MPNQALSLVAAASDALKERVEEVNKLNVFPVPDGDTGTNMSLTMQAVVDDVAKLPANASLADACRSVTHGSLMGARGNSGVILSQILRGLCEVIGRNESVDTPTIAEAMERSVTIAFQAVRKPVEGTILTVLRDAADEARRAAEDGDDLDAALERITAEAFESVRRTPELLPTLKENGVVDAGGYGLAILFEGISAAVTGTEIKVADVSSVSAPLLHVEPANDWDDDEYLYCTEFLLHGSDLDSGPIKQYVETMGGSELVVGDESTLKIHVHTDEPGNVLAYMTGIGQVSEVHIHNMRLQKEERDAGLRGEGGDPKGSDDKSASKPVGFVTVASGDGLGEILRSLGADVIVSGGQTMNPSTRDLLDAIDAVDATKVIVMPNNKNIIMAASAAVSETYKPAAVIPTTSIPQSFAALLAYDGSEDLDEIVATMTAAAEGVRSGEVTTAIKDAKGKVGDIKSGQLIGISDHEIEVVGDDVVDVAVRLAQLLAGDDAETLTILAGVDLDDDALARLTERLEEALPDVDIDAHRGDQPLYPVLLSAE